MNTILVSRAFVTIVQRDKPFPTAGQGNEDSGNEVKIGLIGLVAGRIILDILVTRVGLSWRTIVPKRVRLKT